MKNKILAGAALLICASTLSACSLLGDDTYNVTVENKQCLTDASFYVDGVNKGSIPGGGVRTFKITPGFHKFDMDNNLSSAKQVNVQGNMTWASGYLCL